MNAKSTGSFNLKSTMLAWIKAASAFILDAFISSTSNALKNGDKISLVGFGSFAVQKRNARIGRNPQTGKEIKIAAKNVVKFRPGSELSTAVK